MASLLTFEVRTKPGETPIRLSMDGKTVIRDLKKQLANMRMSQGWDASSMNLIRQGRFLDDDQHLEQCGVCEGDFIVATGMVPRKLEPAASSLEEVAEPVYAQAEMVAVEMTRD